MHERVASAEAASVAATSVEAALVVGTSAEAESVALISPELVVIAGKVGPRGAETNGTGKIGTAAIAINSSTTAIGLTTASSG